MEVDSAQPAEQPAPASAPAPTASGESISISITYGKQTVPVERLLDSTVGDLKKVIQEHTQIEPSGQKLLNKGKPLTDDAATLRSAGLKPGTKLMLIGTPSQQVAATKSLTEASASNSKEWDAPVQNEPLEKQAIHAKVLAKGRPEDGITGIKDKQVPLADEMKQISGLLNQTGTKVRIVFRPETQELQISSATHTQKVPYSSITKIEAFPIKDQEEYSIISLQLGSGKYWLYWFPSQHVAALKIRILGVGSLL